MNGIYGRGGDITGLLRTTVFAKQNRYSDNKTDFKII